MRKKGVVWFLLGALCFAFAAFWTLRLVNEEKTAENAVAEVYQAASEQIEASRPTHTVSDPEQTPDYELDPTREMPRVTVDGVEYVATLSFPTLDLKLPVAETLNMAQLKQTPCRYSGTPYRSQMVICAHNYRSHFGRLTELSVGDEVVLTDAEGYVFTYRVKAQTLLRPTAVEEMIESEYDLTLFTCDITGRSRFAVRLDRIS